MSFVLIEACVLLGLSVLASIAVLYYYTMENGASIRPRCSLPILFLAFVIAFCPIGLLVVDIGWAAQAKKDDYNEALFVGWRVIFWVTQAMSWVVLPLLQEYTLSGEFTTSARLRDSVKENMKLYLIVGLVLIGLLVYLAVLSDDSLNLKSLTGLAIASSNAFGLLLIILFLGYGLGQLPRHLWRHSLRQNTLTENRWMAPGIHEKLETTRLRWSDMKSFVTDAVQKVAAAGDSELRDPMEQIGVLAGVSETSQPSHRRRGRSFLEDGLEDIDVTNLGGLKKLHKKAIQLKNKLETYEYEWEVLVRDSGYLEDMEKLATTDRKTTAKKFSLLWLQQVYHIFFRKNLMRFAAFLTCLISLALVWSFAIATPIGKYSLVEYLVIDLGKGSKAVQQLSLLILFPYASATCYWALFRFKLFEFNLLVPHFSHPANLCFTVVFLCRLIIPLCFCFLNLCGLTGQKGANVAYTRAVVQNMNTVALLGDKFNRYMPCLLLVVTIGTVTDVLPKLITSCGLDVFAFGNDAGDTEHMQEGTDLLRRERRITSPPVPQANPLNADDELDPI